MRGLRSFPLLGSIEVIIISCIHGEKSPSLSQDGMTVLDLRLEFGGF